MGIFVWDHLFIRFAKCNLATLNFILFLSKQIYDDLEESQLNAIDQEWEEEEEEETTVERMSLNQFLILGDCCKGLSPPIPVTEIVGKWYVCIFKAKNKTYLHITRANKVAQLWRWAHKTALEIVSSELKLGVTKAWSYVLKLEQQDIGIFCYKRRNLWPITTVALATTKI